MTLIRWAQKPIVANDINRFYSMFNSNMLREYDYNDWSPNFETLNIESSYIVRAELPGLTKQDVSIEIVNNYITISGEKKNQFSDNDMQGSYTSCNYGSFKKRFSLPEDAIENKIEAKMKDGILTLNIPRVKPAKPKIKKLVIK